MYFSVVIGKKNKKKNCLKSVLLEHQAPIIMHYYFTLMAKTQVCVEFFRGPGTGPGSHASSRSLYIFPLKLCDHLQGWETKGQWWKSYSTPLVYRGQFWKSLHSLMRWPLEADVCVAITGIKAVPRMHCSSRVKSLLAPFPIVLLAFWYPKAGCLQKHRAHRCLFCSSRCRPHWVHERIVWFHSFVVLATVPRTESMTDSHEGNEIINHEYFNDSNDN